MNVLLALLVCYRVIAGPDGTAPANVSPDAVQPVMAQAAPEWLTYMLSSQRSRKATLIEFDRPLSLDQALDLSAASKPRSSAPGGAKRDPAEVMCSVNVADWELSRVLQALSEQTKANLVLLASTAPKLTLRLTDVKLLDMIRHICAVTGLSFLRVGGAFVIASSDQLKAGYPSEWQEANPAPPPPALIPTVTKTYVANYALASQIQAALAKAFPSEQLLCLVGPASRTPSVAQQDSAAQTTGASTSVLTKDTSGTTEGGRMLVLRGPEDLVDQALAMAKQMDLERPLVSIAVTIYDISNEALKELGLSWTYSNINISESNPRGVNFGSFTRAPLGFSAVIKALETRDNAKLLAAPNVSVLDDERAFILIGNRINFPVLIGYSNANTPIFDKQTERVGIYLQVAASVSDDNQITLSLYPQVSTITGFLDVNGASYPQISTREAQTTLRVRSGESIVLGGLFKDEEITQLERVPLLSQIPLLGELFTRRKRTKKSSQVIINITPVVLPSRKA